VYDAGVDDAGWAGGGSSHFFSAAVRRKTFSSQADFHSRRDTPGFRSGRRPRLRSPDSCSPIPVPARAKPLIAPQGHRIDRDSIARRKCLFERFVE